MLISNILQILLAVVFSLTGVLKIVGNQKLVDSFEQLKLPQWFRVVTGWVQLIGVAGLILGFWYGSIAALAGLWLTFTMLGGTLSHMRVNDPPSKVLPTVILAILAAIITVSNFTNLANIL